MATPEGAKHRDLEQRFKDLDRKLRELASAALRRPQFEVSAGDLTISGGDLIVDGGDFLLLDTDGSTVFRLGPQQWGDRGVSIFREDGTLALGVRRAFEGTVAQNLEIRDRDGNLILGEEPLGIGLQKPFLPVPLQPVRAASGAVNAGPHGWESTVAAGTWTNTHRAWYARHNQYVAFRLMVAASDTTTAAEVQVVNADTGAPLARFFDVPWLGTRPAGTTGYVELAPPRMLAPGAPDDLVSIAVQVRRTAGAGSLTVAVPNAHGA